MPVIVTCHACDRDVPWLCGCKRYGISHIRSSRKMNIYTQKHAQQSTKNGSSYKCNLQYNLELIHIGLNYYQVVMRANSLFHGNNQCIPYSAVSLNNTLISMTLTILVLIHNQWFVIYLNYILRKTVVSLYPPRPTLVSLHFSSPQILQCLAKQIALSKRFLHYVYEHKQ